MAARSIQPEPTTRIAEIVPSARELHSGDESELFGSLWRELPSRYWTTVGLAIADLARTLERAGVCHSHGLDHALRVTLHAIRALQACDNVKTAEHELAVVLAALLHDVDDRKFFPTSVDYENARRILRAVGIGPTTETMIIQMVDAVSASHNGDRVPPEAVLAPWLLYPRHADRLEACGWVSVVRCWDYTVTKGIPLFTADTPRCQSAEDVLKVATPQRYAAYRGDSASMIDHYYDKLLHLKIRSGNAYLDGEASRREGPLTEVCLIFGATGGLPPDLLDKARRNAEKEANVRIYIVRVPVPAASLVGGGPAAEGSPSDARHSGAKTSP